MLVESLKMRSFQNIFQFRLCSHAIQRCALALLCLTLASPAAKAAPDFSKSEIKVSNEAPLEGSVTNFDLIIRNSGDTPAEGTQIRIKWPMMGHMIKFEGLSTPESDYEDGALSGAASIPAGGEHHVIIAVLAPRDAGGDALSLSARMAYYPSNLEHWLHKTVTVETAPRKDGVLLGGLRVAPAGIAVIVWLVVFACLWLAVKVMSAGRASKDRMFGPGAAVSAIMISVGFWAMFAVMAWRDYQALSAWPQSTATILSRRTTVTTSSSSRPSNSGSRTSSDVLTPEFALEYEVDGKPMISTGFDTGSSLHIGGKVRNQQEIRNWTPGTKVPCWYNPADPADVVVRRGFGGAYLFALFPLPVFWIGLRLLRRAFRGE